MSIFISFLENKINTHKYNQLLSFFRIIYTTQKYKHFIITSQNSRNYVGLIFLRRVELITNKYFNLPGFIIIILIAVNFG